MLKKCYQFDDRISKGRMLCIQFGKEYLFIFNREVNRNELFRKWTWIISSFFLYLYRVFNRWRGALLRLNSNILRFCFNAWWQQGVVHQKYVFSMETLCRFGKHRKNEIDFVCFECAILEIFWKVFCLQKDMRVWQIQIFQFQSNSPFSKTPLPLLNSLSLIIFIDILHHQVQVLDNSYWMWLTGRWQMNRLNWTKPTYRSYIWTLLRLQNNTYWVNYTYKKHKFIKYII